MGDHNDIQVDEVLTCATRALRESHADEKREHESAIARLTAEDDRLTNRIHAMYVDKLNGRIDRAFYERVAGRARPLPA